MVTKPSYALRAIQRELESMPFQERQLSIRELTDVIKTAADDCEDSEHSDSWGDDL